MVCFFGKCDWWTPAKVIFLHWHISWKPKLSFLPPDRHMSMCPLRALANEWDCPGSPISDPRSALVRWEFEWICTVISQSVCLVYFRTSCGFRSPSTFASQSLLLLTKWLAPLNRNQSKRIDLNYCRTNPSQKKERSATILVSPLALFMGEITCRSMDQ